MQNFCPYPRYTHFPVAVQICPTIIPDGLYYDKTYCIYCELVLVLNMHEIFATGRLATNNQSTSVNRLPNLNLAKIVRIFCLQCSSTSYFMWPFFEFFVDETRVRRKCQILILVFMMSLNTVKTCI